MKKKILSVIAFLIPVLVLFSLVLDREIDLRKGKVLILPMTGYDPVDLLSGHYLLFRLDLRSDDLSCTLFKSTNKGISEAGIDLQGSEKATDPCVCYSEMEPTYVESFLKNCSEENRKSAKCWVFLRGTCKWNRFDVDIHKYFIPEGKAKEYEDKLRKTGAKLKLRVNEEGRGTIETILWNEEGQ
ncbi:GDYXXLXY domain-containing protein [Leptospira perolatii]|uniref:GDYXXLXY domain-containing protein n=1 Tax=Leptospira perolatii TaxID=2023191 RepID=UPI0013FD330D|nr:GDYXXLXY domain-containing protein [Leptospira perolatii]